MKHVLWILLLLFSACSSLSSLFQFSEDMDTEAEVGISISSQNNEK
jgi:hypothetical protein